MLSLTIYLLTFSSAIIICFLMPRRYRDVSRLIIDRINRFFRTKSIRTMQTRSVTGSAPPLPRESMPPMPVNMQEDCPFFKYIPGEIRDRIFQYAVTEHALRKQEYEKNTHYYRPGFRFADQKIDTALLLTCKRIYQETKHLPSHNYVQVEWCFRAPPSLKGQRRTSVFGNNLELADLKSLHLFTQQFWLESWGPNADKASKRMPNLQYLKITIRHGDWWYWESSEILKFDPKQRGMANMNRQSQADDPFHENSWGNSLQKFPNLKLFELELESIEGKRIELDDIVKRAPGWRFPLSNNQELVLNPKETTRTGRIGLRLPGGTHVPNDPVQAKERLVKDGVDFTIRDGEAEITGSATECLTYYTVTLFFETRRLEKV